MELNAPISILARQHFSEGSSLAPFRDDRNTPQAWKKSRVVSQQNNASLDALQQIVAKLSRQRRKPLGGFVPQTFAYEAIHPFQFYSVAPNGPFAINDPGAGYVVGDIVSLAGGTLAPGSSATTLKVSKVSQNSGVSVLIVSLVSAGSYSTQPTYPNAVTGGSGTGLMVTAVSSSDAWRTCSMRQGVIGLRSRFWPMGETFNFISIEGMNNFKPEVGNFQQLFAVNGDWQQSFDQPNAVIGANFGSPLMLGAVDVPVLISGIEETQGDFVNWPQIVLNAPDSTNVYQASFWLQIVDSKTSKGQYVHPNLMGQMFSDTTDAAFPLSTLGQNNVNIIPLAIVATLGGVMYVEQFLTGNLINLFDSYFNNTAVVGGSSGLAAGSKLCYRGDWTADSLSGQYFYPGDIVRDVVSPLSVVLLISTSYVCLNYITTTIAPHSDTTNWLPLVY